MKITKISYEEMKKKYILSKTEYNVLKSIDLSEVKDMMILNDEEYSFKIDDIDDLLMIIDEAITMHGLASDQETANEYGRKLYSLYDSIYEQ